MLMSDMTDSHIYRRRASIALATITLAIVACSAIGGRKGKTKWEDGASERMADYMYMEALRQNAIDSPSNYFELLDQSYKLDSAESAKGFELGYMYLMTAADANDTVVFKLGYDLMNRHFVEHPDDYYYSVGFAELNARIGYKNVALKVWNTIDSLFPTRPEVTYKYAEALNAMGDSASLARAIAIYNRLESNEGKDLGIVAHKVRTYYALGDTASITRELNELFESAPHAVDNRIYAADLYMAMDKPNQALEQINIACSLDSTSGEAINKRANIYLAMGDTLAFNREAYRAIRNPNFSLEDKMATVRSYAAELYTDTNQHDRIYNLFDGLLEQYPGEIPVRDLYASYLYAIGDSVGAIAQTKAAIDIDPTADEQRWARLIQLNLERGDYAGAVANGAEALTYFPESSPLAYMISIAYSIEEDYPNAITTAHRAIDGKDNVKPSFRSQVLCTIGDCFQAMQCPDSAFAYYEEAIEANPGNILALNNYAYFLAEADRDLEKAERMSAIVIRDQPWNPTYLDTYAWIMFKRKNFATAREYIDSALNAEDNPGVDLLEHAGDIYFNLGLPDDALTFWKRAQALSPDNELLNRKVKHRSYFDK